MKRPFRLSPLLVLLLAGFLSLPAAQAQPTLNWVFVSASGVPVTASGQSRPLYIYLTAPGDIYVDDVTVVAGSTTNGVNVLTNGGFETGALTPWTIGSDGNNSASVVSINFAHSGNRSLHLITSSGGTTQNSAIWQNFSSALTPNATYTLGFWYRQTTNANGGALIVRFSSSGISTTNDPAPPLPPPPDSNSPTIFSLTPTAGATVGALTEITVVFTKPVDGVSAADLLLNGQPAASVSTAAGTNTYTFGFTQPLPGTVQVSWEDPIDIADLNGNPFNGNAPGASWTYTLIDTVAPHVSELTPVAGAQVSRLTRVEATFSEPVFGVDASDLLINGQPAASVTGSGAGPYVFQFAQPAAGTVQFAWAAGHGITDTAAPPNAFAGGNWSVTLNPGVAPGDVIINEFVAASLSGLADEDGEVQDWIELYNHGTNTVNLLGWSLTDDDKVPGKWVFPSTNLSSGKYLVVFASGKDRHAPAAGNRFHTNFKLSAFGDYLALFNAESPRVPASEFAPAFPEQRNNYSYGLDSSNTWRYYLTPTPGAANGSSAIIGIAPQPHFSVNGGLFDAPFNLVLTTMLPGATIRYTTDGTEPTAGTGFVYSGPIVIANTVALRAAVFLNNYLPSRTRTHTYIFPDQVIIQPNNPAGFPGTWGTRSGFGFSNNLVPADYEMDMDPLRVDPLNPASPVDPVKLQRLKTGLRELPVVSIVMRTNDLFGASGFYDAANVINKAFPDKPCSVEMFLPDGTSAFAVTCGIGAHGNASRQPEKNPKHGFKLSFKGEFGESSLNYQLFPDSPVNDFDDLIVRADFGVSWRHWSDNATEVNGSFQRTRATRTRDPWIKETARDMGVVASHSRFCNLFINGVYWGTYDFTEQPAAKFAGNNLGGTDADYDIYEQGSYSEGTPPGGSAATYNAYQKMTALPNATSNAGYDALKQYLDVTEYIDYVLLHFFVGHRDWGSVKNWYAIRPRAGATFSTEGKFKYAPWDGECILLWDDNQDNRVPGSGGGNTDESQTTASDLHAKLAVNAQYRLDFADRVHKHMVAPGGALTSDANIARWLWWSNVVDNAIVAESARWGDYRRDVHPYQNGVYALYTRENQWLTENSRIVGTYFPNRKTSMLGWLRTAGLYPTNDAPEYRQDTVGGAIVGSGRVPAGFVLAMKNPNGTGVVYYTTNGADPRVYYLGTVSGAAQTYSAPLTLNASVTVKSRVLTGTNWSTLNEATFTIGEPGVPLRITEIMYNPIGGNQYEFLEVQNVGALPLDLGGFNFQGVTYIFPNNTIIQPGAVLLLANGASPSQFAVRYPSAAVFGYFSGNLDNGGERIAIFDRGGRLVTAVNYDDEAGWPTSPDGGGYSLEVIDPRGDQNSPANWRASSAPNGTPGLPPATPALGDVVLNEIMADNASTITNGGTLPDWIELYNRSGGPVNLTNWSLTDSGNARKYVFPDTNLIAGGFLIVWCDTNNTAPGLHSGFAISRNGENISLYDANTNRVDAISFGAQLTDYTIGRVGDNWQLTVPTPGAANLAAALASPTNIAINEWMAKPVAGVANWLELFNRSSNAPVALRGIYLGTSNALFQIRALSFLPPRGFIQLFADELPGPDHLDFKLPSAGGIITLSDETGLELERVTYGPQNVGISEGRLPNGTASITAFNGSVSPGMSNYFLAWSGPVLNEVLAHNDRANLAPWNSYADWVEIYNPGGSTADLSGMALGPSDGTGGRWTFPSGVTIPAGGYLTVWCDSARAASTANVAALNTGFSLSGDSGDVYLFNTIGQPVDWVNYGFQLQDVSIGRSGGTWHLLASPTPGTNNSAAAALGAVTDLRINEWMAGPLAGNDWVELYNTNTLPVNMGGLYFTDDPSSTGVTNFQIAPLSFIDGRKWVEWEADGHKSDSRNHAGFSLDKQGETIRLYTTNLMLIDGVDFGLQSDGVSQGRLPDGATNVVSFPSTPSPSEANYLPLTSVVINEVLTHTDPPIEDAIELFNPTTNSVDISGWWLSDSQSDLKRYQISNGTLIPPGGFKVFYQNQFGPPDGEADIPPLFSFNSAHGDAAYLSEADGNGNLTGYRAGVTFGAAAHGVSFGRYQTSVGVDFTAMSRRTFGADDPASLAEFRAGTGLTNAYPFVGPVVINEIMYHPPTESDALTNGEFIELLNISNAPTPLFDPANPSNVWRLANAVSFDFPTNTIIPAGGYLLVVPFNPTNLALLAAFQTNYGSFGTLVGPYSGKLDNAGESVELYRPDPPQPPPHSDAGFVPYVLADRVAYSPLAPWPVAADGGGASLQRIVSTNYGNDPANWMAGAPTAGRVNVPPSNAPPIIVVPPGNQTVVAGQSAAFTVLADGPEPLTYQWLFNNSPLAGETGTNLTLSSLQSTNAGEYRVQVTNNFGSILSEIATLTVLQPPTILTNPLSQSVNVGSNALFTVAAAGDTPFHYQWRHENSDLPARTNAALTITSAQVTDAGNYRVVITNIAGTVTSGPAMLTVQSPPVITADPVGGLIAVGGGILLTVSATGDAPLHYQWRINGTNISGAAGYQLPLSDLVEADSGNYTVLVTNSAGGTLSTAAVLFVVQRPLLTGPHILASGGFTSSLYGPTNWVYAIEATTNFSNWFEVTRLTNTTGLTPFVDTGATNSIQRYYRAHVLPPE